MQTDGKRSYNHGRDEKLPKSTNVVSCSIRNRSPVITTIIAMVDSRGNKEVRKPGGFKARRTRSHKASQSRGGMKSKRKRDMCRCRGARIMITDSLLQEVSKETLFIWKNMIIYDFRKPSIYDFFMISRNS